MVRMESDLQKRLSTAERFADGSIDLSDGRAARFAIAGNRWIKRCGRPLGYSMFLDRGVVDVFDSPRSRWVTIIRSRRRSLVELPASQSIGLWSRTPCSILTFDLSSDPVFDPPAPAALEGWIARLLEHPLVANFPAASLAAALCDGVYERHAKDSVVVAEGTIPRSVRIVVDGVLRHEGERLGAGEIFGDRYLLGGTPCEADAVMEESGVLLRVGEAALPALLDAYRPGADAESVPIVNLDLTGSLDELDALDAGMRVRLRGGTDEHRTARAAALLRRGVRVL